MDLIKALYFFVATEIFIYGLKFIEPLFFKLAIKSTALLNVLIDKDLDEDEKQGQLLKNIGGVLSSTFIFLFAIIVLGLISVLPVFAYKFIQGKLGNPIDFYSYEMLIAMATSIGIHKGLQTRKKKADYGNWSKLFHRLVLNNYNIGKFLFKAKTKKLNSDTKKRKVIVSGLARSGTSAFTQKLHEVGQFTSLTYASVPFLMYPQTGLKLSSKSDTKQKERAHGDKVLFGVNSIEALEEYFFKVMTKDCFIEENTLNVYEMTDELAIEYENYIRLICKDPSTYLSKNNNFILRAKSQLEKDNQLKLILMVRNPFQQAESLLNQHLRFTGLQEDDSFTLEYMNWLAHHEFGKGHKPFKLNHTDQVLNYHSTDINHWLASWLNYYDYALQFVEKDNVEVVIYEDFVNQPADLFRHLSSKLDMELKQDFDSKFESSSYPERTNLSNNLIKKCADLYQKYVDLGVIK